MKKKINMTSRLPQMLFFRVQMWSADSKGCFCSKLATQRQLLDVTIRRLCQNNTHFKNIAVTSSHEGRDFNS